jgi:signal transduction histidine kinase/HAMP domain-containing protein/CheY-like chemotaxis protein
MARTATAARSSNGSQTTTGDAPMERLREALRAAAAGDFSHRLPARRQGVAGEVEAAYNELVERNARLSAELERMARVIGREGRMTERAQLGDAQGEWARALDAVNGLVDDLARPTTEVARVLVAVAEGDLTQKMAATIEGQRLKGEFARIGTTVNTMVDQLRAFADEVTRVAREVGTEGKLGGQAEVPGVAGTWKSLTDNVNFMANNLTDQVRGIAEVTTAVADGDLTRKITVEAKGEVAALADTINTMVDQLSSFADEVTRVAREVGTEGKLGGQAKVPGVGGTWKDLTDNVNFMARNLTDQVRNIALVTTAIAQGDLSQKITIDAQGEILELKSTINTMVDQLSSFADEVTRVAREVGTEGELGGQAEVPGVAGTWKSLTDNVNSMARNLTDQVRNIALVTTAIAGGDLSQKITIDAQGEILELKSTINTMVEQLSSFADEVTRVAREVGTEGKLGGQAEVEGVSGTWKALTQNVNQLAANLTTQVRAIADVSTAVTQGDLTRSITVEAQGEVAELKDTINQMIGNLRATTQVNAEQDWLKTNIARISGMLQGQRDLAQVTQLIMSEVTPVVSAQHGAFFLIENDGDNGEPLLRLSASYGYRPQGNDDVPLSFALGEGLVGQAALEARAITLADVPEGYIRIRSALGEAPPAQIAVLPIMFEEQVLGVVELASLRPFAEVNRAFLDQLTDTLGIVINTIQANMRTEELLAQSQALTQELQTQSEELRQTNDEMQEKALLLQQQNRDIEIKNAEIELARAGLEEKAAQLAISSNYKSEFLANMSHELRTPLNSLLILSRLLAENSDGNLDAQQVEFASTIHAAGNDLLALINDILDLSKVEAGKMEVHLAPLAVSDLCDSVDRAFRPLAEQNGIAFAIDVDPGLPPAFVTDEQRLTQVLRNLLSNAFKFTHEGAVTLRLSNEAGRLELAVNDTGIGIDSDKLALIFEAFQQADGTTSRKYGGTGLGLKISREIARLLGGEIRAASTPRAGSTFTLVLPLQSVSAESAAADPSDDVAAVAIASPASASDLLAPGSMPGFEDDDRALIQRGDRVVLVIARDASVAAEALEAVRAQGVRGLVARRAPSGLALAREHRPDAIVVFAADGGDALLGQLKQHPETRDRPVYLVGPAGRRLASLRAGAAGHLTGVSGRDAIAHALADLARRAERPVKRLALVQNGTRLDPATLTLLGSGDDVDVVPVDAEGAASALHDAPPDCAVLPVGPQPEWAFALLHDLAADETLRELPLVAYVPEALDRDARTRLERLQTELILETVSSPERLVDETALFLHRSEAALPAPTRTLLAQLRTADSVFKGKRILIVDDDIRNVFALASALEMRGMKVVFAENGREGIQRLHEHPDVDLVLLDVMMPEMDGYETARAIRSMPRFEALPIVSLTAKAMEGDRDKSIAAGASDYITKPVDIDQLLNLMRVWLHT